MSSQTHIIKADDFRTFPRLLEGKARSRHHAEYAGWHAGACWNGRRFDRFPEYIVRAQSLADVASTIDFARSHRFSIGVRGNGHSYAGCFMRDSGILLDLSALKQIEIDATGLRVSVQPGVTSRLLSTALAQHGLAFPTGHGGDVGVSGFLLGGGIGINFRAWGDLSTFSVYAVDVMLADGRLVHADAEEHPELFWAARGAGPVCFFVVVKFYAQWNEECDDDVNRRWLKGLYDDLADVATDCYVNEFDLEERSESVSRCFARANWLKLQDLRQQFDPDGVFHDTRLRR